MRDRERQERRLHREKQKNLKIWEKSGHGPAQSRTLVKSSILPSRKVTVVIVTMINSLEHAPNSAQGTLISPNAHTRARGPN